MSKRSSRRKRKQKKQQQQKKFSGPVLIKRGTQAFKRSDYNEAIANWELAFKKKHVSPPTVIALAEAYFRRAMRYPSPLLADLQHAARLQPSEQRYQYHLALAHQRAGDLEQAEPIYRKLLDSSPPFKRAAAPLAQLLIQQKKAVLKDPVWKHLSQQEQTQLAAAEALIKNKATSTLQKLADQPLQPIWQGLIAMALKDYSVAKQAFQTVLQTTPSLPTSSQSVVHYYLGALAVIEEQIDQAITAWQTAKEMGLDTIPLTLNLSFETYQQFVKAYQAKQPNQALILLSKINGLFFNQETLAKLRQQLTFEMGYKAAQAGEWDLALQHWRTSENNGNKSRKITFNLALAYQKLEWHYEAAEKWRELLRRRPRKASHPEALTDEQVSLIWQTIAENYSHAEEYDQAVTTYKNAIKWAPDNIDLKLKLVDALQTEGRWQAAENELNRILDKKPDYIPALILLAESYSEDFFPDRAIKTWKRILELEPKNPIARQHLVQIYIRSSRFEFYWDDTASALEMLKEGLELVPDSWELHLMIGMNHLEMGQPKKGKQYFNQALALNNSAQALFGIFASWLEVGDDTEAEAIFAQIKKTADPIPPEPFIKLVYVCLDNDKEEWANKILEFIQTHFAKDTKVLVEIANMYVEIDKTSEAISILRRILTNNADHAEANLALGTVYYKEGQTRLGKRHWKKAELQAKKENDQALLYQLKLIRDELVYGKKPSSNPFELLGNMPPEVLKSILKDAPPEIAEMLNTMSPEEIASMLMAFGGFDDDDDDEFYGTRRK